jgi:hypothetical protein
MLLIFICIIKCFLFKRLFSNEEIEIDSFDTQEIPFNYSDYKLAYANNDNGLSIVYETPNLPYFVTKDNFKLSFEDDIFLIQIRDGKIYPNDDLSFYSSNNLRYEYFILKKEAIYSK